MVNKKLKPDLIDDDNPEWTKEDFARARPAREFLPELVGKEAAAQLLRKPGQRGPQKNPTKVLVSMRLDPDVLDHFRSTGPGWQSRINDTLANVIGADQAVSKKRSAVTAARAKAARSIGASGMHEKFANRLRANARKRKA